jgi:hypothetical protein
MSNDIEQLIAERKTLTDKLAECEAGAFPGTKAWMRENKAMLALGEFDKANPEVRKEIMRRKRQTALKGVDVEGL